MKALGNFVIVKKKAIEDARSAFIFEPGALDDPGVSFAEIVSVGVGAPADLRHDLKAGDTVAYENYKALRFTESDVNYESIGWEQIISVV